MSNATAQTKVFEFHLIDGQTGKTLAVYPAEKKILARRRRDKLDAAYGGYRYSVKMVEVK